MSEATLQDQGLPGDNQEVQVPSDTDASEASTEVETETGEETGADPEASEEKAEKKPTGFARRTEKIQQKLTERERELEYWKNVALNGNAKPAQTAAAPEKPVLAQFSNVEDYVEARAQWDRKQLLTEIQQTTARQAEQSTRATTYEQKVREAMKTLPDWTEVMAAAKDDPASNELVQLVQESEVGPQMAYYLAKNPEEHERLNAMSPLRRVAELGKLEDKLLQKRETKTTSAPSKLGDVKGTEVRVAKDPSQATSYTEWKRLDDARKKASKK